MDSLPVYGLNFRKPLGSAKDKDMSDEQPQFKVTDRRLFNADGTPREIAAEEVADKKETPAGTPEAASAGTPGGASPPATGERAAETNAARAGTGRSAEARAEAPLHDEEEEVPGEHDPASFVNFLMSIASNAAAALGMMEHPVTGERGVDLQLGKHWIDVLGMLEQKTRGNLSRQEEQILEGLLADLRMQFVSLSNSAPSAKQRFTGRDIIGGK